MSTPPDRRQRKRRATRDSISDTATRLFAERGFDHVTVDEIAAAADVGRMTVFNHFKRKEDMFFDREEEIRAMLQAAVRERAPQVAPVDALCGLAQRLVDGNSLYVRFSEPNQRFFATIEGSAALKARARALRDEMAHVVALALADGARRPHDDPDAHLAAGMLLATWTVAGIQALGIFRATQDAVQARAVFLATIAKGAIGIRAALAGTPYA